MKIKVMGDAVRFTSGIKRFYALHSGSRYDLCKHGKCRERQCI